MKNVDLVRISNYPDRLRAEMAKSQLDALGILSYVQADDAGSYDSFLLIGGRGAFLVVRQEDADRATAALLVETPDSNHTQHLRLLLN